MKTFININLETFQTLKDDSGMVIEYNTKQEATEATANYIDGEYFAQPLIKQRAKRALKNPMTDAPLFI